MDVGFFFFFGASPMDIMENWFRTQPLLHKLSSQTSRVSCQRGLLTHADILSELHEASPLLSATRFACRSNQVVARGRRLHVHVSALSLWCLKNVRNVRLMWHLSICGEWSG